jgi:probable addiction module antidote protein/putative addiction module killer protein
MSIVHQTAEFSNWLRRLRDDSAAARIVERIRRLELGNPGDVRTVGGGVSEIRIDYGAGYRVYFVRHTSDCLVVGRRQAHADAGHQAGTKDRGASIMATTTRFDAADYLNSEKRQVAYISAALESGDADFIRDALGIVARARGMSAVAKNAGLNRESLYKALGESGHPEFETVMRIVRAMGVTLSARRASVRRAAKRQRVA